MIAVVLAAYAVSTLPTALDYWRSQAPVRELAREAAKLDLTYEDVVALSARAAGKPVRWPVLHPTKDLWHYAGDPSLQVSWAHSSPDIPPMGKASRIEWIVAIVVSSKPGLVTLNYKGRG